MVHNKNFGFTLIEILVTVAIISLLSSIIFVAITKTRARSRDAKRIADLRQIQKALEVYIQNHGSLPSPGSYGRSNVSPGWWDGWWDLSTNNGGNGFMNFLVTDGIISKVPTDPTNSPSGYNGPPTANGYQYFYFVAPKSYLYQGGSCVTGASDVYLIGVTNLESDKTHPPNDFKGSDCGCLWNNLPNMFQNNYSYIICGY